MVKGPSSNVETRQVNIACLCVFCAQSCLACQPTFHTDAERRNVHTFPWPACIYSQRQSYLDIFHVRPLYVLTFIFWRLIQKVILYFSLYTSLNSLTCFKLFQLGKKLNVERNIFSRHSIGSLYFPSFCWGIFIELTMTGVKAHPPLMLRGLHSKKTYTWKNFYLFFDFFSLLNLNFLFFFMSQSISLFKEKNILFIIIIRVKRKRCLH